MTRKLEQLRLAVVADNQFSAYELPILFPEPLAIKMASRLARSMFSSR